MTGTRKITRISPTQLDELIAGLHQRDGQQDEPILRFLDEYHYATGSQLQRLYFTAGSPAARTRARNRTLERMTGQRLLHRAPRFALPGSAAKEHCYELAHPGQRVMNELRKGERPYRSIGRTTAHFEHALAVTEVYVQLVEAQRTGRIADVAAKGEPACHIKLVGSSQVLRPDAYMQFRTERGGKWGTAEWFIEIERSDEGASSTLDKLEKYLAYEEQLTDATIMPQVLFVALKPERRVYLERLLDRHAAAERDLFIVASFNEAVEAMITGATYASR